MVSRWKGGSGYGRGSIGERRKPRVQSLTVESERAELELVSVQELGAGLGTERLEMG
jgi:hypothetical protein